MESVTSRLTEVSQPMPAEQAIDPTTLTKTPDDLPEPPPEQSSSLGDWRLDQTKNGDEAWCAFGKATAVMKIGASIVGKCSDCRKHFWLRLLGERRGIPIVSLEGDPFQR